MCCLHYSSRQFSSGSYSGFCFIFFIIIFKKAIILWLEGVVRDKLVFGMKKHDHVSFQILTRDSYSLDFGTKPLINTLLIVFLFFFYFCLGHPFGFSTYRVRTSCLLLGSLEAHAWCLSLPQFKVWRYMLLSFLMTL